MQPKNTTTDPPPFELRSPHGFGDRCAEFSDIERVLSLPEGFKLQIDSGFGWVCFRWVLDANGLLLVSRSFATVEDVEKDAWEFAEEVDE